MCEGATVHFIICITVNITDRDSCIGVAIEEEEEIYIDAGILALIGSIECIGGIECSDINHSKLVTSGLSRDIIASNEQITTNSSFVIVVDIV